MQKDAFRGRGAVVASSLLIVPRGEVTHEVRRGVPSCMIITFFRVLLGLVVCMVDSVDVEWGEELVGAGSNSQSKPSAEVMSCCRAICGPL